MISSDGPWALLRQHRRRKKNSGPPTDAGATNFVRSTQAHRGLQCPELAQLRPQIVPWSTLCRADVLIQALSHCDLSRLNRAS
jgi:hypothetical protein